MILGNIKAYYGDVEAQDRGTLHLHIEAWFLINIPAVETQII
jgi:hypothetical protein